MNKLIVDKLLERQTLQYQMSKTFEWEKWMKLIPLITLPEGYSFRPIPPFGGAVVRFHVEKDGHSVSVYLDCYDNLGFYGKPYWEIYPASNNDIARFDMDDTKSMVKGIVKSINKRRKEKTK